MIDFSQYTAEERTVLIADDEPIVHRVLGAILQRLGFTFKCVSNGIEALGLLENNHFTILFSDVNMPGMDGVELTRWVQVHRPDMCTIVISGGADLSTVVEVMKMGAFDYIQKPFSVDAIAISLSKSLEKRMLLMENRRYQQHLENIVLARTEEVHRALEEAGHNFENILVAFALALETREHETQQHSIRVKEYSLHLARHLNLPHKDIKNLEKGALLHDIGKIGVPDAILLKNGPLNEEEWVVMRKHPEIGSKMLHHIDTLENASHVVMYHHERFDGRGYPTGCPGPRIPIEARIFAIADTVDAMTSDRPYRKALTFERAYQEVRDNAGKQFDPELVEMFLQIPDTDFIGIRQQIAREFVTSGPQTPQFRSMKFLFADEEIQTA